MAHAAIVKLFAERGRGLAAVAFVLGADLEAVEVGADLQIFAQHTNTGQQLDGCMDGWMDG